MIYLDRQCFTLFSPAPLNAQCTCTQHRLIPHWGPAEPVTSSYPKCAIRGFWIWRPLDVFQRLSLSFFCTSPILLPRRDAPKISAENHCDRGSAPCSALISLTFWAFSVGMFFNSPCSSMGSYAWASMTCEQTIYNSDLVLKFSEYWIHLCPLLSFSLSHPLSLSLLLPSGKVYEGRRTEAGQNRGSWMTSWNSTSETCPRPQHTQVKTVGCVNPVDFSYLLQQLVSSDLL